MKKALLLLTIVLLGFQGQAQGSDSNYNKIIFDFAYGLSIPFGSDKVSSDPNADSFISFTNINLGARYMFTNDWGVRGSLGINNFHGGDNMGTNNFQMNAQAYYNLGRLTNLMSATNDKVGLLVHSGFGITWSKSIPQGNNEHMGNYIIGLSPIFKINTKFAISSDFSYTANFKQNFQFDGISYQPTSTSAYKTGNQFGITIGLIYYFGKMDLNADWK